MKKKLAIILSLISIIFVPNIALSQEEDLFQKVERFYLQTGCSSVKPFIIGRLDVLSGKEIKEVNSLVEKTLKNNGILGTDGNSTKDLQLIVDITKSRDKKEYIVELEVKKILSDPITKIKYWVPTWRLNTNGIKTPTSSDQEWVEALIISNVESSYKTKDDLMKILDVMVNYFVKVYTRINECVIS